MSSSAALEPEVAVLVLADVVAGRPPLALEGLGAEVAAEEGRARSPGAPRARPRRRGPRSPAAAGPSSRRGPVVLVGPHPGHRPGLGLPVAVVDRERRSRSRKTRITSGLSGSPGRDQAPQRADGRSSARLASIRYSVGAWQRTFTPSRSISSRRSAGSKRASWISAAAPLSQGAMKTLRVDFDQPGAAVHQASSPFSGAEPVLGLEALAGQVALRIDDPARLAGGPRGEDDHRRVVGVQLGDSAGVSWARSSSRTRRPRPVSSPAPRRAARRAAAPRRCRAPDSAARARSSRSLRRSCGLQGSATAPIRKQASIASTHSTRLPTRVITASPRLDPARRDRARRARR